MSLTNQKEIYQLRQEQIEKDISLLVDRFGLEVMYLAAHMAVPIVITPHLAHVIRTTFLDDYTDDINEADVLLSPFFRRINKDVYEVDGAAREILLENLELFFGEERIKDLSRLLQKYSEEYQTRYQQNAILKIHYWVFLLYQDHERLIREILNRISKISGGSSQSFEDKQFLLQVRNFLDIAQPSQPSFISLKDQVGLAIGLDYEQLPQLKWSIDRIIFNELIDQVVAASGFSESILAMQFNHMASLSRKVNHKTHASFSVASFQNLKAMYSGKQHLRFPKSTLNKLSQYVGLDDWEGYKERCLEKVPAEIKDKEDPVIIKNYLDEFRGQLAPVQPYTALFLNSQRSGTLQQVFGLQLDQLSYAQKTVSLLHTVHWEDEQVWNIWTSETTSAVPGILEHISFDFYLFEINNDTVHFLDSAMALLKENVVNFLILLVTQPYEELTHKFASLSNVIPIFTTVNNSPIEIRKTLNSKLTQNVTGQRAVKKSWYDIGEYLSEISGTDTFISRDRYTEICKRYGVIKPTEINGLLEYMESTGRLMVCDEANPILLDPNWLSIHYRTVLRYLQIEKRNGLLDLSELANQIDFEARLEIYDLFIDLLKKMGLCLLTKQKKVVFYEALPSERPSERPSEEYRLDLFSPLNGRQLFYLLVKVYERFEKCQLWKNGILLFKGDTIISIELASDASHLIILQNDEDSTFRKSIVSFIKKHRVKLIKRTK